MDGYLRQATASQSRAIGAFIDDTDFKTPKTGLTIANTDIKLSVNGAASANKNSGGGTHRANGNYGVTWDATDTATVGQLEYSVLISSALLVWGTYTVLEEAVYDQLFAASAPGASTPTALAAVQADTDDIQTRLPAALVSGRIDSSVGAYQSGLVPLQPTVAGRTLDITATGEAGIDWNNIGAPTTAQNLSGTTIKAVTDAGTTTTADKNDSADKLLARDLQGGSSSSSRNIRNSLRVLRNKVATTEIDPTTGTVDVYEEDDTTIAWSADLAKSPGDPITSVDPT